MIVVHSRKFALLQAIVACIFFFSFFLEGLEKKNYMEFSRLDCGLCKFVFLYYFCFFFNL